MLESELTTSEVLHLNLFGMFQEKDFTENNSKNSKCSVIEEESVALSSLFLSSFTPNLANSTATATSTSSSTRVPDNESSVPNNENPLLINTHTDVHTHTHTVNDVHTQTHSQSPTQITQVPTTPLSTLHVDTHIHTSAHTDTHTVARTCTDNHHLAVPSVGVQNWDFLISSDSTPLGLKDDDNFYRRLSNLNNMNQKRTKIENLKKKSFTRQYSLKEE